MPSGASGEGVVYRVNIHPTQWPRRGQVKSQRNLRLAAGHSLQRATMAELPIQLPGQAMPTSLEIFSAAGASTQRTSAMKFTSAGLSAFTLKRFFSACTVLV